MYPALVTIGPRGARLASIEWPEFGAPGPVSPWAAPATYAARLDSLREWLARERHTHFLVYGDREHFANLLWLAGLDPRFEESFLVLPLHGEPLLAVGNECASYAPASPAVAAGLVSTRVVPELSLPDQPPFSDLTISGVLREAGIESHSRVAVAGWKPATSGPAVPAHILDPLRFAAGWENVIEASRELLRRRAICSLEEIAYFEFTNALASDGMRRVIHAVTPGALDYELLAHAAYPGVPLGCHMTLKCGANTHSLASARGERVIRGGRFSCGICYWGANVCRAGWVAESPDDLPRDARDYLAAFAFPYFEAMAAWFDNLRIGSPASVLHRAVATHFGPVKLNAGHLIHYDEWLSSPVGENGTEPLQSGMLMQSDVIPSHPVYYSTRMEDAYLLASPELRRQLAAQHPGLLARCLARRDFMRNVLGLPITDDVLPFSNIPGLIAPFLLAPSSVLVR